MHVSYEERVGYQELLLKPPAEEAGGVVSGGCECTIDHAVGQGADAKATSEDQECLGLVPTQTGCADGMRGAGGQPARAAEFATESSCGRDCAVQGS